MVKTTSSMLALGTPAADFSLLDVTQGRKLSLAQYHGERGTVVMFICNHCPYVRHISAELSLMAHDYLKKPIKFIAINSNDVDTYPDDSPENMKKTALEQNYPFPYLFDETQEVAMAYQASCTPDFYIFNHQLNLVYRGQLDDSRPGSPIPVTGSAIRHVLDALIDDKPIEIEQKPSIGCNIKWKTA